MTVVASFVVPVHPHPLLVPETNEGYGVCGQPSKKPQRASKRVERT